MLGGPFRIAAATVALAAVAGCALAPAAPYQSSFPLTAHLPIGDAGIRDLRRPFALVLAAELGDRYPASEPPSRYLHLPLSRAGVPAAQGPPAAPAAALASTAVLVVPGFLGECFGGQALPFSDGAVRESASAYRDAYASFRRRLGVRVVEAVPVGGRWTTAANAKLIAEAIMAQAKDAEVASIVVVAYSKGVADTIEALTLLQNMQAVPAKLGAIVSVAGVVMGTPIADRYSGLYEALGARLPLAGCPAMGGDALEGLTTSHRVRWLAESPLPASVALYSVVAYAERSSIGPGLRPFYDFLARSDPQNDGQVRAADAILPGSGLLAAAISDHWDFVLPLSKSSNALVRGLTSGDDYPRDALFSAILRYVVGETAVSPSRSVGP